VILLLLVGVSLLLGRAKIFKGGSPGSGMIFGLINGYLLGAFLLTGLPMETPVGLWLPFGLSREGLAPTVAAAPAPGRSLADQFTAFVQQPTNKQTMSLIIAILIALFVIVATRLGSKGVKKG
jgi:hypothetical protein